MGWCLLVSCSYDLKTWLSLEIQNIKGSITALFLEIRGCVGFSCMRMINKGSAVAEVREARWQMFLELRVQMSTEAT